MTSRSEYRLLLAGQRRPAADPIGYRLGLVPEERMQAVREKYEAVDREIRRLEHTGIPRQRGTEPAAGGAGVGPRHRRRTAH